MAEAFWRACLTCWHPRVLLWTLLPLLLAVTLVAGLGWFFWETALDGVRDGIDSFETSQQLLRWMDELGGRHLRTLVAPIVVVGLSMPLVLLVTFALVALLAAPALARHVGRARCAGLQLVRGASRGRVWVWTLLCCLVALVALALSVPLWLVPPLVLLLPPLIWGWLTTRVLSFAALAAHASRAERHLLLHRHRWALWAMGLVCGAIASLPSLVWVAGAPALVAAPLLAPLMAWLYTAVFVFAACWFSHFLLPRLQALRARQGAAQEFSAQQPAAQPPRLEPTGPLAGPDPSRHHPP
jgi:hypothetical protein